MKARTHAVPNVQLRRQREQRHWTQTEMARMLGTTYLSVCRWENGTTSPSLYYRKRLCELFELPAEKLGLAPPSEETIPPSAARTASLPPPTLWHVPYRRNPFFTGRERILLGLHTMLRVGKRASLVQAQAISGLGGIGKTQTAIEYAYRFREHYQAILWCRAETRNLLLTDLVALAQVLDLQEKDEQEQERVVQAVRRWLQNSTSWLLILDNVEDLSLVEDALPSEYSGHVLLTTRAQSTGTFAQRIDLEQMEQEEGALFLLRRAKLIRTDAPLEAVTAAEQAKEIARLLDGLPLALDQAGAYIEETGCSLADYLERYRVRRAVLLNQRGRTSTDHPESAGATLSLALGKVERANPAAAELLRLCAFLDPDAIPEEIMTAGAADLGPVLAPVAADPVALDAALADLRRYSLLRRNPESKTLTIHRLVQEVLRDQMNEQVQQQWAERCVRAVNRTFPVGEFANWQQCQRVLPHALSCVALLKQWNMSFVEAAQLLERAGNYLMQREQYQEAEPLLKQAVALHEQILGLEHPEVATSLNELATLYWNMNKFEQAEPLFRQALDIREKTLGPEHPEVANSLNNLALVYQFQGCYSLAEPLFTRSLTIWERISGANLSDLATGFYNLGTLYIDQGKYDQAEVPLRRALTIWEQTLVPDHPDLTYALHFLAVLYTEQGRYTQAEPLFQQALAIREQAFGPEHSEVAHVLNNLATLYRAQGKYTQAESLFQRAFAIGEKTRPQHRFMTEVLNQLALLYLAQGKYTQAESLLTRSLAISEQVLGRNHPHVALSLDTLTQVYCAQDRDAEAEPLIQRALTICDQRLGAEHPNTAQCLTILGMLYCKQGRYVQAEQFLRQALTICEQRLGVEHPHTARSLHELAKLYSIQRRYTEAESLFQRALTIREQKLGAEHPDTLATRERYAAL